MDNKGGGKYDLNKYCAVLAAEFPFAKELNSMARQSAAERAWFAISRFYDNCQKKVKALTSLSVKGKKGFPKFKKHSRSVEYKTSGWQLSETRKAITFSDKKGIGTLKLKGTWDLNYYDITQIKRVRLVRQADGYYAQFAIAVDAVDAMVEKSKKYSYAQKKARQKPSKNYHKARNRYARKHLRVSRQRKEYCKRLAYSVIQSTDLNVKGLARNRKLAKSISDAGWSTFRSWLEYFGVKYGKVTVAAEPRYTSQECSNWGQ